MNVLIGTALIWLAALAVLQRVRQSDPSQLRPLLKAAGATFLVMLPRTAVGLVGAGFMAALLPRETMGALFGPGRGAAGIALATLAGVLTPGGPIVAFALAGTALKAGAATGALIAYVSAWSVFSLTRTLGYELALMGGAFLRLRLALSLPFPFLLGLAADALTRLLL